MNKYKIFIRNWWKHNSEWPNGLEPDATARKKTIAYAETEEQAIKIAKEYNATHKPGKLSRKAEITTI